MQQQELAQIRHREANLTALAAIGPRKKRKTDAPVTGASAEVGASPQSGGALPDCVRIYMTHISQQGCIDFFSPSKLNKWEVELKLPVVCSVL